MKTPLLIVDGYNMIGAWPELVLLKNQDRLEDAREALFDAQLVPGVTQSYSKYQLQVIFTEEGETADSYIERIAGELNDRLTQVTVATSDLAEQWVVFSQGALRTSARELYKSIEKTEEAIHQHQTDIKFENFRRNSPWTPEQLAELEKKLHDLS